MKARRSRPPTSAPRSTPRPGLAPVGGRGNAAAQDALAGGAPSSGLTGESWLDGALEAAFGSSLDGVSARFGEGRQNSDLGARAHTRGTAMSFGDGVRPDAAHGESLEIIGHEVAHALAGGGSGETDLDHPGDAGESRADEAGRRFRRWGEQGFQGAAPRLRPAHGGQAEIHRVATASSLTGSPMLRRGSRGGQVALLQSLLNRHGFHLAVDGDFGLQTHRAVRSFQASHRLLADGVVGPRTAAALGAGGGQGAGSGQGASSSQGGGRGTSGTLTGSPALRRGSAGAAVRTLQGLLNDHGAHLGVDGEFGPVTERAVRRFQAANGLTVDGIVGPRTADRLGSGSARDVGSGGGGGGGAMADSERELRDLVIEKAARHLGKRYWWGADGPAYFDCSGFVLYVLRQETGIVNWGDDNAHGIMNRLPRTNDPQRGDLVFFWSGGRVQHVEICTGSGSGTIGAGGGGSQTFGNDPNAKVKWDSWGSDGRSHSFGSIGGLIDRKLAGQRRAS